MSNLIWGTERGKKREEAGMQMGWREKGPDFGFKALIRDNPKGNGKALRFLS